MRPLILIEFNELSPNLLQRWMGAGRLPNFERFHNSSRVYVTYPDVEDPVALEPWIQWYSLHTGLPFEQHGVFHLTDGPKAGHRDIWTMLIDAGFSVFNCCSMNARRLSHSKSIFIPDPWCTTEPACPRTLQPFADYVASQVQEYSNRSRPKQITLAARFVKLLLTHGLSRDSVSSIMAQLVLERKTGGAAAWRRVAVLDKLQFDLFSHLWRKHRPDFSTFFVNSTAHLQHTYWRYMEPDRFVVQPTPVEIRLYNNAILYGYQQMDRLLGRFMKLETLGAQLVLVTALSQQPFLKLESAGGQHFYRPLDIHKLLTKLGVHPLRVRPVMTHQFLIDLERPAQRNEALNRLEAVRLNGSPVFGFDPADGNSLYFGSQVHTPVPTGAELQVGNKVVPFYSIFYAIDAIKSGSHHPDGCLWFKTGEHCVHPEKVSILDVLPTVAAGFGINQDVDPGRILFNLQ